jgi:hypothetical protein
MGSWYFGVPSTIYGVNLGNELLLMGVMNIIS